MKIKVVCVGKIKESFYREAIAEYVKRLSRFCKFEIVEVAEELCNNTSEKNLTDVKFAEGQRMLAHIKGFAIVLDIHGNQLASDALAQKIDLIATSGTSEITFVIGGSYGLDKQIVEKADLLLSFGLATYPHQLMRVILTEQIYRAYMINEGSAYHK